MFFTSEPVLCLYRVKSCFPFIPCHFINEGERELGALHFGSKHTTRPQMKLLSAKNAGPQAYCLCALGLASTGSLVGRSDYCVTVGIYGFVDGNPETQGYL